MRLNELFLTRARSNEDVNYSMSEYLVGKLLYRRDAF